MTENIDKGAPHEAPPPGAEHGATQAPPRPEPPAGAQSQAGWNTENLKDYRRLRRSREDRKVAGVAGGLGRHLNIDPTILRVLFVVLIFFGGAGFLLYGALWLFVPEEGSEDVVIGTSESTRNALLIAAAVIAGLLAIGDTWSGFGFFPWPLAVVGLVLAAVLLSRDRNQAPPPAPGPYAPPPPPGYSGAGGQAPGPYAPAAGQGAPTTRFGAVAPPAGPPVPPHGAPPWYPPQPPPAAYRPRRSGPILFGLTVALVALALGALGLYDASGHAVDDAAYPALALAVIGLMLVVGAFFGRAGGLIATGLVAALVLTVTAIGDPGFEGDRDMVIRPTNGDEVVSSYKVPAGRVELDLTQVRDLGSLDGRSIRLEANAGEIVLVVPEELSVDFDAQVAYGGSIETPVAVRDGWDSAITGQVGDDDAEAEIDVELDLDFGRIEVKQR